MTVLDTSNGIFVNRTHAYIILQARRERVISDPNEAFKAWHAAQPSVLTENFFSNSGPSPSLVLLWLLRTPILRASRVCMSYRNVVSYGRECLAMVFTYGRGRR